MKEGKTQEGFNVLHWKEEEMILSSLSKNAPSPTDWMNRRMFSTEIKSDPYTCDHFDQASVYLL